MNISEQLTKEIQCMIKTLPNIPTIGEIKKHFDLANLCNNDMMKPDNIYMVLKFQRRFPLYHLSHHPGRRHKIIFRPCFKDRKEIGAISNLILLLQCPSLRPNLLFPLIEPHSKLNTTVLKTIPLPTTPSIGPLAPPPPLKPSSSHCLPQSPPPPSQQ